MSYGSVGQDIRQGTTETAHLCSMISGASVGWFEHVGTGKETLFLFWLPWVFIASWAFLILLCRLSCPKACGILLQSQPGIEPASPALEGGFLTTGPWGSPRNSLSTLSHFTWAFMKNSAFGIVSLLIWWFWAPRERKQELPNLLKARPETSLISSPPPCSWSKQS